MSDPKRMMLEFSDKLFCGCNGGSDDLASNQCICGKDWHFAARSGYNSFCRAVKRPMLRTKVMQESFDGTGKLFLIVVPVAQLLTISPHAYKQCGIVFETVTA